VRIHRHVQLHYSKAVRGRLPACYALRSHACTFTPSFIPYFGERAACSSIQFLNPCLLAFKSCPKHSFAVESRHLVPGVHTGLHLPAGQPLANSILVIHPCHFLQRALLPTPLSNQIWFEAHSAAGDFFSCGQGICLASPCSVQCQSSFAAYSVSTCRIPSRAFDK
jgi:hypothetical protein